MHIRKTYLKGARLLSPPHHSQLVWKSSLCLLKILNGSLQSIFSAPITQHLSAAGDDATDMAATLDACAYSGGGGGGGEVREVAGFKPGSFCGLQAGHKFYPPPLHSHTALLHLLLAFPASQLPATHAVVMSKPELELTDMYRMRREELRAELKTKGMKASSDMLMIYFLHRSEEIVNHKPRQNPKT